MNTLTKERLKLAAAVAAICAVGVTFSDTTHSQQTVSRDAVLNWTPPTACKGGTPLANCVIRGYSIQKLSSNGSTWLEIGTTLPAVTTYSDKNLPLGTYTYRVLATSDAGPSDPSNSATRTIDVPGAVVLTVTVTITTTATATATATTTTTTGETTP